MMIEFPKDIIRGTFSLPKKKDISFQKTKLKKVIIKDEEVFQFSNFTDKQVFHENVKSENINETLNNLIENHYNCLELTTTHFIYYYKISKGGKLLTTRKKVEEQFISLEHNKKKNYLLDNGQIIPPLVDLGVMTKDGQIVKSKYEKYRQINRFLEIIDDCIKDEHYLKIVDFGCGKSYLTFIIYYYLKFIKRIDCDIVGLDLKQDVIDNCNKIAAHYGYDHLHFLYGDISQYQEDTPIDMMVTLHACDTATDYALAYAITKHCRYIFSVPCCQHEINAQLKTNTFHLLTKYGILKERFSALMTDALRANILQYYGYKTQVLEFIDLDASPKNILLRATYEGLAPNSMIVKEIEELLSYFNVEQTLYHLMFEQENK